MDGLITLVVAVLTFLGGGGLVQLINLRQTRRLAARGQDVTEDDALAKRWEALARTQAEALIEPLQAQIDGLKRELGEVKTELATARAEAAAHHTRYWRAIGYIRTLRALIDRFIDPTDITVPEAPADILADI